MHIVRLQIEGGFLDGFDVEFAEGLNVLIGARGTGKTSVIELLRFALSARNHTGEAGQRSTEHAAAVLQDGMVTVSLSDVLDDVTVSRGAGDREPQASGEYEKPLIFSQTEIENVGLSETGRLKLLDGFMPKSSTLADEEAAAIAAIRSAFKEIGAVEKEREGLAEGLDRLELLQREIKAFEVEEAKHRASSADLEEKQQRLEVANTQISSAAVRESVLERFTNAAGSWAKQLSGLHDNDYGPEDWSDDQVEDPLADFRTVYLKLLEQAESLAGQFKKLSASSEEKRKKLLSERLAVEAQSREIRLEVERTVSGAGGVSRQLSQLRTERAQLLSRRKLVEDRDQRIQMLRGRRDDRIKALDAIRSDRFSRRSKIAENLTKALSPEIKVEIERYGQYADYNRALTESLRGSGLRYNDLVASLSQSVSPRELVDFIDSGDFLGLSDITGIPKDRAARLLGHLRENGAADIVTASIEDNVRMLLLDGVDYKDVEHLSAGQRCTVVLSIVLQHSTRTLIIDQPEDHLDNAYIATTVIKAIQSRKATGQLIISTHNANIPVLGDADMVVEMTSDGKNGFVQMREKLNSPKAVTAITNVMEGGREAFANRAAFYEKNKRR